MTQQPSKDNLIYFISSSFSHLNQICKGVAVYAFTYRDKKDLMTKPSLIQNNISRTLDGN